VAHDVFISYSHHDKPQADAVCATLEAKGIRCWIAPRDVIPGQEWGAAIVDAIRSSRVMVLVFSSHANASPQIRREVERAVSAETVLIPFRIEDVLPEKSLEYFLGTPHWLDALTPPLEAHLEHLAADLSPQYRIASITIRQPPLERLPATVREAHDSYYVQCRADGMLYHAAICAAARQRDWTVMLHRRGEELGNAARALKIGARDVDRLMSDLKKTLGPPWTAEHRNAFAAAIVALRK